MNQRKRWATKKEAREYVLKAEKSNNMGLTYCAACDYLNWDVASRRKAIIEKGKPKRRLLIGDYMHNTRKTHNAHNETQRRLKKLVKKDYRHQIPHYNIVHYKDDGVISHIEPSWDFWGSNMVVSKTHNGDCFFNKDIETLNKAKEHTFYVRVSKSKSSYWGYAKKRLHRIWRRKNHDELTFTYKDAKGCSMFDLW